MYKTQIKPIWHVFHTVKLLLSLWITLPFVWIAFYVTYWRSGRCCWQTHWGTFWRKGGQPQERSPQRNWEVLALYPPHQDHSPPLLVPKAPRHIVWRAHCHRSERRCTLEDKTCQFHISSQGHHYLFTNGTPALQKEQLPLSESLTVNTI